MFSNVLKAGTVHDVLPLLLARAALLLRPSRATVIGPGIEPELVFVTVTVWTYWFVAWLSRKPLREIRTQLVSSSAIPQVPPENTDGLNTSRSASGAPRLVVHAVLFSQYCLPNRWLHPPNDCHGFPASELRSSLPS